MAIFMTHILEAVQHLGLKFQNVLEDGYDCLQVEWGERRSHSGRLIRNSYSQNLSLTN
jgi:hypothetical protein